MSATGSLEDEGCQPYHQPRGMEHLGIEPIPERLTTAWRPGEPNA